MNPSTNEHHYCPATGHHWMVRPEAKKSWSFEYGYNGWDHFLDTAGRRVAVQRTPSPVIEDEDPDFRASWMRAENAAR